ncbi:MAG: tripartite tricarboxylate transporter substrate binding protein [Betaproteobacteria bacterium]|nr:tripartite tricarboxylate transporter substrate binding protein [Betaproteobacteria bacterium]
MRMMTLNLRTLTAGLFLLLAGMAAVAQASQATVPGYPNRPVRFVVAQAAGGNADFVARMIAGELAKQLGQQFVVDNRSGGGGGVLAADLVAKASPDGYTMLLVGSSFGVNPSIYKKLPYDSERDFAPVTLASTATQILVVNPSLPVNTVADLIKLAQARPGELNFGSSGNGGGPHLAGELFNLMAGTKIVHVPYKGASGSILDLLSGRIQVVFATMPSVMTHVRAGKLRGVAVTSLERSQLVPDLPTIAESGLKGYQSGTWQGIFMPRGTPEPIVRMLNQRIVAIVHSPEVRKRFEAEGGVPVGNSPQEFAKWLKAEIAKWAKVVKAANIVVE